MRLRRVAGDAMRRVEQFPARLSPCRQSDCQHAGGQQPDIWIPDHRGTPIEGAILQGGRCLRPWFMFCFRSHSRLTCVNRTDGRVRKLSMPIRRVACNGTELARTGAPHSGQSKGRFQEEPTTTALDPIAVARERPVQARWSLDSACPAGKASRFFCDSARADGASVGVARWLTLDCLLFGHLVLEPPAGIDCRWQRVRFEARGDLHRRGAGVRIDTAPRPTRRSCPRAA